MPQARSDGFCARASETVRRSETSSPDARWGSSHIATCLRPIQPAIEHSLAVDVEHAVSDPAPKFYFEDIVIGAEHWSSAATLEREEMIAFARQWDPLPLHLDDEAARASGFEGITTSGSYLLAVKNRLLYQLGLELAVIVSFGFDEVRFRAPGRPGDIVRLRLQWIEKRLSNSRPGTGIAKHSCELVRGDSTVLLSLCDTVLIARRPGGK